MNHITYGYSRPFAGLLYGYQFIGPGAKADLLGVAYLAPPVCGGMNIRKVILVGTLPFG
jgi:hypothetical protein